MARLAEYAAGDVPDGTDNHNVTLGSLPDTLVLRLTVFSPDDTKACFVGEWW
ncbi:MAG: hypothetical protein JW722_05610 [Demequinaceae bacterium]|nr:hypothetical protein [Demequinaceae bacterium]